MSLRLLTKRTKCSRMMNLWGYYHLESSRDPPTSTVEPVVPAVTFTPRRDD